ncbi:hypothetical protein JCM9279_002404 [Rhodotorula babjevae]
MAALLARLQSSASEEASEGEEVDLVLEHVEQRAGEHAMDDESLCKGYELTLSGLLDTDQSLRLLPHLIPKATLPLDPILLTISCLGDSTHSLPPRAGRVDYAVQRRALEQLAILIELGAVGREGLEALDRLYGAVEQALRYRILRDPAATLLSLITRKPHVQPHRVARVQSLLIHDPSPPASLSRLLDEYRSFEVDHVRQSRKRDVAQAVPPKNLEAWKMRVSMVREGCKVEDDVEERHRTSSASARLADLSSLADLAENIDTAALPTHAASVLSSVAGSTRRTRPPIEADRARSWGFLLRSGYDHDPEHLARLSHWIISQLEHELHDLEPTKAGHARVEDLLCRVREICELGGELVEALEPFLASFLESWDGERHRTVVLQLVALLKPLEWADLDKHFLSKLRGLAETATADWVASFVDCLSALARSIAVRDSWSPQAPLTTSFGRLDPSVDYFASLESLLKCTDGVILDATVRYPTSLVLRTAALDFYESALLLPLELDLPVVILPSPAFTYLCLLSNELVSVSRICGIVGGLREALTGPDSAIVKVQDGCALDPDSKAIEALNAQLVTLVNTLWMRRFLVGDSSMGLSADVLDGVRSRSEERGQQGALALGVTAHGALAVLARDCLSVLAAQENKSADSLVGPVTTNALKLLAKDPAALNISFNEFRPRFVEFLEVQGAKGLASFLFSSLSSLIERRKSSGGGA